MFTVHLPKRRVSSAWTMTEHDGAIHTPGKIPTLNGEIWGNYMIY